MTWRRIYWVLVPLFFATWLLGAALRSVELTQAMAIIAVMLMVIVPVHGFAIEWRKVYPKPPK